MPIEVRELIIRATVVQEGKGPAAPASNNSIPADEAIINTCVEKVLKILKDKHER